MKGSHVIKSCTNFLDFELVPKPLIQNDKILTKFFSIQTETLPCYIYTLSDSNNVMQNSENIKFWDSYLKSISLSLSINS